MGTGGRGTGGREPGTPAGVPEPGPDPQSLLRAALRRQLRIRLGTGAVRRITCTGGADGPDLLAVLAELDSVTPALLVEPEPLLARHARAAASELGLEWVQVRTADPGAWDTYATWGPADLLLTGGLLETVRDADVPAAAQLLPTLLAARGIVLWTRDALGSDDSPHAGRPAAEHARRELVRRELLRAGFDEVAYAGVPGTTYRVGVHRLAVPPRAGAPGSRLLPA